MTDNLPALPDDFVNALVAGIAESRAQTSVFGGKPMLRMLKTGTWVFGQSNDEVQEGSRWVVNPTSFKHGWCCWVDGGGDKNRMAGEIMVPVNERLPAQPPPIDNTPFKPQREYELKCLDGDDAGTEVRYKINSLGGLNEFLMLIGEVAKQLVADRRHPCPVVRFYHGSYPHPKWGQVLTPVVSIVDWADINGVVKGEPPSPAVAAPTPAAAAPAVEPPKPARQRKAPLATAVPPPPPAAPAAPIPPVATAVGQRRRPSRPAA